MREARDRVEPEDAGVPLDGVRRAEDAVQQLDVAGRLLELEQPGLEIGEQLRGLLEEDVDDGVHVWRPGRQESCRRARRVSDGRDDFATPAESPRSTPRRET